MKKSFKIAIASVALFATATALAMGPKHGGKMFNEEFTEQRLEIVDQLNVSDSLKDELKTLITEHDEQLRAQFEDHRETVSSVRDNFKSNVEGLLSDEEHEEFKQAMKELRKQKFKEGRKHKGPRHQDSEES
jgi:Spy/CpxP family protein refolding chaperone